LILFFLFVIVYIIDSFFLEYSIFLTEYVSNFIRIPVAVAMFVLAAILAMGGMKKVFGTGRSGPGVITDGVFRIVRHPIYLGAILFYLTAIILSLSIISFILWTGIVIFYFLIAKYEEKLLTEEFGEEYRQYKKSTGMLVPKLFK